MVGINRLAFVIAVLCVALSIASQDKVRQCLKDYIPKISEKGLDTKYINALRHIADHHESREEHPNVKVVLDVGLGSMWHSDVFRHMIQLNVSGFDQFKRSSFNCEFDTERGNDGHNLRDALTKNPAVNSLLYAMGPKPNLPSTEAWYDVLSYYPNVKVLMNDVTDEEYFSNQHIASCIQEWQGKIQHHCFVPVVEIPRLQINVTSSQHMLTKFSFDQVKVMLSAYRELIKCTVPPENLFQFNLNQMPAVEYWRKLTSFLNISLPASGVKYLSEGGSVCDSEKQHTDGRHVKRVQCADEYGANIASIYGERYRGFVRDMLLKNIYAPRRAPEDTDRLVLGIGPGTSGTRTVHFSVTQLNITSSHYQSAFAIPPLGKNITHYHFEYDMKALAMESADRRVFWSDTPVPTRWWYLYKMYPNTNFMITDVRNDTAWWENKFKSWCNLTMRIMQPSCTAPLPIRFDKSPPLAHEFFRLAQFKVMSMDTNHRTFDAYRSLIRCMIPQDKIWWLYLIEQKDSEEYWTRLIKLVDAKLSPEQKADFVARGIPRCGSKGCFWNGIKYKVNYR